MKKYVFIEEALVLLAGMFLFTACDILFSRVDLKDFNFFSDVTHLAGPSGGAGYEDGTGSNAYFHSPYGITSDDSYIYITEDDNNVIRRIEKGTWEVTTIAGEAGSYGHMDGIGNSARFFTPVGITNDETYIYVIDDTTIRRIEKETLNVTTVAGQPDWPYGNDGIGAGAGIFYPSEITCDESYLYIVNNLTDRIRIIEKGTWEVTTIVKSGLVDPEAITCDESYLYITDTGNCTIKRIIKGTWQIKTIAGLAGNPGDTDGRGSSARFRYPCGIKNDGSYLYVTDSGNYTIRRIEKGTWNVETIAGTAGCRENTDGTGSTARFIFPYRIESDGLYLYVTELLNHTVRMIDKETGMVTTIAGKGGSYGSIDGTGSAARFYEPHGIVNDGLYLYIADTENHTIRRIGKDTQIVDTIAGIAGSYSSTDGAGSIAQFNEPGGITTDDSYLYVADTSNDMIRRIEKGTWIVDTIAGVAGSYGSTDGAGSIAQFNEPGGIISDGSYLYVVDSRNHTIRRIEKRTWKVETIAGSASHSGSTDGIGSEARFYYPEGITSDGLYLYVADKWNCTIRRIEKGTWKVDTIAGLAVNSGSTDGIGSEARFRYPTGITSDEVFLYITDAENHTIRRIEKGSWKVDTIAGFAGSYGFIDGSGSAARFSYPQGITCDNVSLYVADTENHAIRRIK